MAAETVKTIGELSTQLHDQIVLYHEDLVGRRSDYSNLDRETAILNSARNLLAAQFPETPMEPFTEREGLSLRLRTPRIFAIPYYSPEQREFLERELADFLSPETTRVVYTRRGQGDWQIFSAEEVARLRGNRHLGNSLGHY